MDDTAVNDETSMELVNDNHPDGWRVIYLAYFAESEDAAHAKVNERLALFVGDRTDVVWHVPVEVDCEVDFEHDRIRWRATARLQARHGEVRTRTLDTMRVDYAP